MAGVAGVKDLTAVIAVTGVMGVVGVIGVVSEARTRTDLVEHSGGVDVVGQGQVRRGGLLLQAVVH